MVIGAGPLPARWGRYYRLAVVLAVVLTLAAAPRAGSLRCGVMCPASTPAPVITPTPASALRAPPYRSARPGPWCCRSGRC